MPALPSRVFNNIVGQLAPHLQTEADRKALLTPALIAKPVYGDIDWSGGAQAFTVRLVELLATDDLVGVLQLLSARGAGAAQREAIAGLCDQIRALGGEHVEPDPFSPALADYRRDLIDELSKPRYQIDTRFVRLTLLVDQGQEAQGTRFVEDSRKEYSDLRVLLADVEDPAVVLLGAPGSGKTTLLRRLQLDDAQTGWPTARRA